MTEHPNRFRAPVAVHLLLVRGDAILLLRRFNTGYEDGNYSVVAGHLDGGETVLAAIDREAREEAGIQLDPAATSVVGVMHRQSGEERIDFFVLCTNWTGEVTNREPEKCDDLRWFPLADPPPNVIPYVRAAISAWHSGTWFTTYGFGPDFLTC